MASGRSINRRQWLKATTAASTAGALLGPTPIHRPSRPPGPILELGSRRELFLDRYLVEELKGEAVRRLHHPAPREIVLVHDEPWEGSGCGYHSVFKDGDLYRMYYKAWDLDVQEGQVDTTRHPLYCCYAESDDGIEWRKPKLNLHSFGDSTENNIVMVSGRHGSLDLDAGHPAVFKDANPKAEADARYKAIVRSANPSGLIPMQSADGFTWSPMTEKPILTGKGAFDSQNLAFWDTTSAQYRAYWRCFIQGRRAIRTATSLDLINWSSPSDLDYVDSPPEQLYVNQIKPYERAPHILIGFPVRYIDRGWSASMQQLPEVEHRRKRASAVQRYGTALTEGLIMASRDGVTFERWNEAFLRPGIQRPGTWNYGQQYIAWHAVQTESTYAGAPPELSLFATEGYWTQPGSALRRYTLRLDGFASISAPMGGGEFISRPFRFTGNRLTINFATSAAGDLRAELQDTEGNPLPKFALTECPPHFGDEHERQVVWDQGADVSSLEGQPVRLRIQLRDADLYSIRFGR